MSTNIPHARECIQNVKQYLDNLDGPVDFTKIDNLLTEALDNMTRKITRMTPPKHRGVSDEQKAEIMRLAANTLMSQMEIGERVGVNPGRVSEVINGLR